MQDKLQVTPAKAVQPGWGPAMLCHAKGISVLKMQRLETEE